MLFLGVTQKGRAFGSRSLLCRGASTNASIPNAGIFAKLFDLKQSIVYLNKLILINHNAKTSLIFPILYPCFVTILASGLFGLITGLV